MGDSSQPSDPARTDDQHTPSKGPGERQRKVEKSLTADDLDAQNKAKVEEFAERGMGVAGKE